jgi:hypothetical protein
MDVPRYITTLEVNRSRVTQIARGCTPPTGFGVAKTVAEEKSGIMSAGILSFENV